MPDMQTADAHNQPTSEDETRWMLMENGNQHENQHENNSHNKSHYSSKITSHWIPETIFAFALPTANFLEFLRNFEAEKLTDKNPHTVNYCQACSQ